MNHDNNDIKRGICGEIHADPFHVRGGERLPRNIGKPNQTTASPLCQLHDPTIHHLWTKADARINIGTTTPINAKSVQLIELHAFPAILYVFAYRNHFTSSKSASCTFSSFLPP